MVLDGRPTLLFYSETRLTVGGYPFGRPNPQVDQTVAGFLGGMSDFFCQEIAPTLKGLLPRMCWASFFCTQANISSALLSRDDEIEIASLVTCGASFRMTMLNPRSSLTFLVRYIEPECQSEIIVKPCLNGLRTWHARKAHVLK